MVKAISEGFTCTQRQKTAENDDDDDDEKDWEVPGTSCLATIGWTLRPAAPRTDRSCAKSNLAEFLNMRKILVAFAVVLAFCSGQPAKAGVGFGIPLPFPFLVWTPSRHCGQKSHGSCHPQDQDHSGKATTTHADPGGATKVTT
jgi:hypothetical protein